MTQDTLEMLEASNILLEKRFADKLQVNPLLNRQMVSFQANKKRPIYRWFKYKEAFSEVLVHYILDQLKLDHGKILDPFAGTGTALFAAQERGLDTVGIELLPIGCEIMEIRQLIRGYETRLRDIILRWQDRKPWQGETGKEFPHLKITQGAFPDTTQQLLNGYLVAVEKEDMIAARLLRFAAICVLEDMSYTRKDGQYLRWDYRSNRKQGSRPFNKGDILDFEEAIQKKLAEMYIDLQPNAGLNLFSKAKTYGALEILRGSCLNLMSSLKASSFDGIITSPPYANRYDYTRTYALELALLGVDETHIRELRQAMVSCTVENRVKELQSNFLPSVHNKALAAFDSQCELQYILDYLEWLKLTKALNNPGISRMIRNYFWEMTLIITEAARILKPGAPFVMVNDNVRYGGATIPVDLILSDIAEKVGFDVKHIWVLPTGKGNSSQQMGAHGRSELRKCIYVWERKSE